MLTSDISLTTTIIAVAGGISILALTVSKLCLYIQRDDRRQKVSTYECGFEGRVSEKFKYASEKSYAISLYLVLELAIAWLLICSSYQILDNTWQGMYFIKALSFVIIVSLLEIIRAVYGKISGNNF